MRNRRNGLTKAIHLFGPLIFLGAACSLGVNMKKDPFYETFYEKTSIIMTEDEIKVYKMLPDKESKEEFIEEFWKVRDPNAGTEENEAKTEFEERIEYANKWFGMWNPDRGVDRADARHSKTGWATDRGRIYIILGSPDILFFAGGWDDPYGGDMRFEDRRERYDETRYSRETWVYERYRFSISFTKSGGDIWQMDVGDPYVFTILESAKINMILPEHTGDVERAFQFKAKFEDNRLIVTIPVDRVSFDKDLKAKFRIKVNVYFNHRKIDTIEEIKEFSEEEEKLLKRENIIFEVPYSPQERGSYNFDIMVEDMMAFSFSKYRSFASYKY